MASSQASCSTHFIQSGQLLKQGAEAKVYLVPHLFPQPTTYNPPSSSASSHSSTSPSPPSQPQPLILKHRFPKQYRHPALDASLTRSRLAFEARALARCGRAGVGVPAVLWLDEVGGALGLERIEGWSVREILGGGAEGEVEIEDVVEVELPVGEGNGGVEAGVQGLNVDDDGDEEEESEGLVVLKSVGVTPAHIMTSIGAAIARLHNTTTVHGDLTTSNMMVRLTPGKKEAYEIILIDFGLVSSAQFAENYAVDLYVLERAFASTHPASEGLYAGVLDAYAKGMGRKWADIERKLKDVRLRGRKRDMSG